MSTDGTPLMRSDGTPVVMADGTPYMGTNGDPCCCDKCVYVWTATCADDVWTVGDPYVSCMSDYPTTDLEQWVGSGNTRTWTYVGDQCGTDGDCPTVPAPDPPTGPCGGGDDVCPGAFPGVPPLPETYTVTWPGGVCSSTDSSGWTSVTTLHAGGTTLTYVPGSNAWASADSAFVIELHVFDPSGTEVPSLDHSGSTRVGVGWIGIGDMCWECGMFGGSVEGIVACAGYKSGGGTPAGVYPVNIGADTAGNAVTVPFTVA